MNVVSEYQSFGTTRKSMFERNSMKVEKMPVFCKSKRENEKIVITSWSLFQDLYELWMKLLFWSVPYTLLLIWVQFDSLVHLFSVPNSLNSILSKFTKIGKFYEFSAKFQILCKKKSGKMSDLAFMEYTCCSSTIWVPKNTKRMFFCGFMIVNSFSDSLYVL